LTIRSSNMKSSGGLQPRTRVHCSFGMPQTCSDPGNRIQATPSRQKFRYIDPGVLRLLTMAFSTVPCKINRKDMGDESSSIAYYDSRQLNSKSNEQQLLSLTPAHIHMVCTRYHPLERQLCLMGSASYLTTLNSESLSVLRSRRSEIIFPREYNALREKED
jgi:hypothetical protein